MNYNIIQIVPVKTNVNAAYKTNEGVIESPIVFNMALIEYPTGLREFVLMDIKENGKNNIQIDNYIFKYLLDEN